MKTLKINGNDYRISFGFNCFCDTDLLDRVNEMSNLLNDSNVESDKDVNGIGRFKELFVLVRELLFVGFQKHNAVETIQAVGDLLDIYKDEEPDGEKRGILELFLLISEVLFDEGFLGDLMGRMTETEAEQQEQNKVTPIEKKKK